MLFVSAFLSMCVAGYAKTKGRGPVWAWKGLVLCSLVFVAIDISDSHPFVLVRIIGYVGFAAITLVVVRLPSRKVVAP